MADSVLMVKPTGFRSNVETMQDNKFMGSLEMSPEKLREVVMKAPR